MKAGDLNFLVTRDGRLIWWRSDGSDPSPELNFIRCGFRRILDLSPSRGEMWLEGDRGRYCLRWAPGEFEDTLQLRLDRLA